MMKEIRQKVLKQGTYHYLKSIKNINKIIENNCSFFCPEVLCTYSIFHSIDRKQKMEDSYVKTANRNRQTYN